MAEGFILTGKYPADLISSNNRIHWRAQYELNKAWNTAAWAAANKSVRPRNLQGQWRVTVEFTFRQKRRRDPHNFMPTVKSLIDGLVVAGVWPDDTPEHVTVAEPVLVISPARTFTIRLDPPR